MYQGRSQPRRGVPRIEGEAREPRPATLADRRPGSRRDASPSGRKEGRDASPSGSKEGSLRLRRGDGAPLGVGTGEPRLMAVLNLTPDSFSDGGRYLDPGAARARAEALVEAGAELLDLGAESTRPGAAAVPPEEEWRRLSVVLPALAAAGLPAVLSVDTRHLWVAARAADAGARLLNVPFPEGLRREGSPAEVLSVLRRFDGVVLMHARGTPATMAALGDYDGPIEETVAAELRATAAALCPPGQGEGELEGRLLFDPGLGFAKDAKGSLRLLGRTRWLRERLGRPLLVGASRKSFLGRVTGLPVEDRLSPSVAAAVLLAQGGADVLRVHDVAPTRAALQLLAAVAAATRDGEAMTAAGAPEGTAR